jgi:hypothetical protein
MNSIGPICFSQDLLAREKFQTSTVQEHGKANTDGEHVRLGFSF